MVQELSRSEERRGWRKAFLRGLVLALALGAIAVVATPLLNWVSPNRTGQDKVATSLPREPVKAVERATVEAKRSTDYGPYLTDGYGRRSGESDRAGPEGFRSGMADDCTIGHRGAGKLAKRLSALAVSF
jgi:hypothetical protein